LDEIIAFMQKGFRLKGGKGETSRKKAFKDTLKFFHQTIFKVAMPDEDLLLPRRPPPRKRAAPSQKKRSRPPKKARLLNAHFTAKLLGATSPLGEAGVVVGPSVSAPAIPAGPTKEEIEEAERKKKEELARKLKEDQDRKELKRLLENDNSIPALCYRLDEGMDDLDKSAFGTDTRFWPIKSALSNVNGMVDKLFGGEGDLYELEDSKKNLQRFLAARQKELNDVTPSLQEGVRVPVGSVANVLGLLSKAVGAYDVKQPDPHMLDKIIGYTPPQLPVQDEGEGEEVVSPLADPQVGEEEEEGEVASTSVEEISNVVDGQTGVRTTPTDAEGLQAPSKAEDDGPATEGNEEAEENGLAESSHSASSPVPSEADGKDDEERSGDAPAVTDYGGQQQEEEQEITTTNEETTEEMAGSE